MLRQITRQISTKIDSRLWSNLLKVFFTLPNAKSQLARLITKFTSGCSLALCDVDFFTSCR